MMQDDEKLATFSLALVGAHSVVLTASGSSYHAALTMKNRLNREARIRCDAILSGEFKHQSHFVDRHTVLLAVSQSGETADVLDAVKVARANGARILSIVNASGSSLARASDASLQLNCGPEVGVAATKSFTAQVMVLNKVVDRIIRNDTVGEPKRVSRLIGAALETEAKARELARTYAKRNDFYFIARGENYPIALEGALKLKELSYLHAEGMAASELKHGTLALIENGTPVVVINPDGETHEDTISSAQELKARGAQIIGVANSQHEVYDHLLEIPRAGGSVLPILEVIPLQFLAYWMAVERRNDPDYPRNLAKSVTVR
jgi:glucosamine--fructose-6-phosphate aminotransferase (isomerizing)